MTSTEKLYSMKEACAATGFTYDALKFYCNEGLVPNVKRNKSNYRVFDDNDIAWINSLSCLKNCGMSIEEMKNFRDLCFKRKSSIPERKIILEANEPENRRDKKSILYIKRKQQLYDEILAGRA